MKVTNKVEEKMFGRDTLTISIEKADKTPARAELQKTVADKEKANPKLVVINDIRTITGSTTVIVTAQIYKDEKSYKLYVPEYLAKKSVIAEEVKDEPKEEAEAPKEGAKEESAAEDNAEAPAKEEAKEAQSSEATGAPETESQSEPVKEEEKKE